MPIEKENFYTLLSIDALHNGDGWNYNDMRKVEEDIIILPDMINARHLLKFMRRNNWLTEKSKGMLSIEDTGFDIEIKNRKTQEPIYAFRPQWQI